MSPRCVSTTLTFLLIAIPFTVVWWGGFWLWRQRWSTVPMAAERSWFRWMLVWCAIILAEMTVFVCVAADRS